MVVASNPEHETAPVWDVTDKVLKLKIKTAINPTALVVGQIGVNALFLVVKVLKLARGLAKEIIVAKISVKVKTVTNLIV